MLEPAIPMQHLKKAHIYLQHTETNLNNNPV